MRTRPLGFEQLPPLTILKALDLQPLGAGLLLRLQPCGGQFGSGIGLVGADRRGVFEKFPQEVGALNMVGGLVRRNRSGGNAQKQKCDRGEFHFSVTGGGLPSLQAGRETVHSCAFRSA